MRFGLIHRIMTDALAALGVLAIVSTATLGPTASGVLVIGMLLALFVPESWQPRPWARHATTIALLLLFVVQTARLLVGQSAIDVTIEFAAMLQVIRVATRRGAAHDQQIIVLALLHFVAGTVLGGSLAFGLCFLGFLIFAPGALVLSHLRREVEGNYRQGARDRTGLPVDVPRILRSRRVVGRGFLAATCLMAVPIFIFTAVLFVLFPRVGLSLLLLSRPHSGRVVGFSDHVDLGEVGVLRSDPTIALRFELQTPTPPPTRMTLRLRGTAFDLYDGRAWSRSQGTTGVAERSARTPDAFLVARPPRASDTRISFDLEPIDPPVVFLPPIAAAVQFTGASRAAAQPMVLQRGSEGEFRYSGNEGRGAHYEVFVGAGSEITPAFMGPAERVRHLAVPAALPARIATLARQWSDSESTPAAKARAIEAHLRADYRYDLGSPSGGTPQPLDHFLFESKRGHCEFFSTAMAMMLRDVGIPSRNVTGFVGGTYNRFGQYYAVRQGEAHSWVEAYIEEGPPHWVTYDPTPPAGAQPLSETTGTWVYLRDFGEAISQRWNQYVVGYDLSQQARLADAVGKRYEAARAQLGVDHGPLEALTRGPVIAGLLLVGSLAGYAAWMRRRRPSDRKKPEKKLDPAFASAAKITAMFRSLEASLAQKGIARIASMPPLRHAQALKRAAHPLADELLDLTQVYLGVRFGNEPLSDAQRDDFLLRIRRIRDSR